MDPVIPIYYQIKQHIKRSITSNEYRAGDKIPSEQQLSKTFQVSRITIRQAISQLIQEGLLISKRGLGTYVTNNSDLIKSYSLEFSGFIDDLFHEVSKVNVKYVEINKIDANNYVKEKLKLPKKERKVYLVKRLRLKGENVFAFTLNYLPVEIGKQIDKDVLLEKPMLRIIEQDLRIRFTGAFQTIEASFADHETASHMGVSPGFPILLIERVMFTDNDKPIELVQSSHRGDLHKFTVRLKRMNRSNKGIWIPQ